MATYFFVGDGCEVLACEAYEANAIAVCKELQAKSEDSLAVYERDPSELARDDSTETGWTWANPQERFIAEQEYSLPSLAECIADAESRV